MSESKKLYSTVEAGKLLGISAPHLRVILQRKPDLAPAHKLSVAWMWTEKEIERVRQWRDSISTDRTK